MRAVFKPPAAPSHFADEMQGLGAHWEGAALAGGALSGAPVAGGAEELASVSLGKSPEGRLCLSGFQGLLKWHLVTFGKQPFYSGLIHYIPLISKSHSCFHGNMFSPILFLTVHQQGDGKR